MFRPFLLTVIRRVRHIKHKCVCQCFCELAVNKFQLYTHISVKRYKIQISDLKIKIKRPYFRFKYILVQFFHIVFVFVDRGVKILSYFLLVYGTKYSGNVMLDDWYYIYISPVYLIPCITGWWLLMLLIFAIQMLHNNKWSLFLFHLFLRCVLTHITKYQGLILIANYIHLWCSAKI